MYKITCSESEEYIIEWMNNAEKEGYTFVSSNTYSKFGCCALTVIMHKNN